MNKPLLFLFGCIICLVTSACSSKESEAKQVVKTFCEAYEAGQTDKAISLYPAFVAGMPKTGQIDLSNLKVANEDNKLKVEDDANHIFYLEENDGKLLIKDSRNVIEWESKTQGDVTAALILGMVNDKSTDMERINSYLALSDGSDFIDFLKNKYPQALVFGVTVDKVQKKIEGFPGCYWMNAKATLKSGKTKPLDSIRVIFIYKDENGNEITRNEIPSTISSANSYDVAEQMLEMEDYPQVKDVSVELEPFSKLKGVSSIDLLCAFAPLSKQDYQEYLNSKK